MKKVILSLDTNNRSLNAGPKAQEDISNFLSKRNFERVTLNINSNRVFSKLYISFVVLPKFIKKMGNIDEIVIQYPMSRFLMRSLIRVLRRQTKAKIYCVVHDIESLRIRRNDNNFKKSEISLLNSVDGIVVHNTNMHNWLKKSGLKVKAVSLQLFDYDNPQPISKKLSYDKSICFAGNLAKSTFLKNFHPKGFELYLYGVGFSKEIHDANIHYQGSFLPNELPKHLIQNFGLVWDGNSVDSCSGMYGEYIMYNAPHKASLYLSSGIPVIVWKNAGIANYVVKHNLGIAVESLVQLDAVLSKIDFDEYKSMKESCFKEARKLRNGEFIIHAMEKLECNIDR